MRITACTDCGCVYEDNQDYYVAGRLSDEVTWAVLCDGMGGVASGGKASRLAGEFLKERIEARMEDLFEADDIKTFLIDSMEKCNSMIYAEAGGTMSMGTTAIMLVVRGGVAQMVHAGDSRVYLLQKKGAKQLTKDHSIVQELLDSGKITAEQAVNHPNKNIITSAVGIDSEVKIDYNEQKLGKDDMLLLCSDGLSNMVPQDELLEIAKRGDFYKTAKLMVNRAVEAGGYDNITAVVIGA